MTKSATFAWRVRSPLSLKQMKESLNAVWSSPWIDRDSDSKPDSISGAITKDASARVFRHGGDLYTANLYVQSSDPDFDAQVSAAQKRFLEDALPLLEPRTVTPKDPDD